MTRRCNGFTMIELVVVVAIIGVLIALLLPSVQSAREAARRMQCTNNLLQIGVAIASYEATYQVLPPGTIDAKGPIVESPTAYQFGWIARILPYMEQKNVARNIDYGEGAYRPQNDTARTVPLHALVCPSDASRNWSRGTTATNYGIGQTLPSLGMFDAPGSAYAACHNEVEAPIDTDNTGAFVLNKTVRSLEIEDGLSHTIFVGEKRPGGDELGWASGTRATLRNTGTPINQTTLNAGDLSAFGDQFQTINGPTVPADDTPQPPTSPGKPIGLSGPVPVGGFGSSHPLGSNFLFGDGSVHFLRANLDVQIYRLLGNRADGELLGDDQF